MKIRPMTLDDVSRVVAIEQQVQYAPWSQRLFAEGLERGHECKVLEDNGDSLLGFSVVQYIADEAHLLDIAVHPAVQGRGYGRELLTSLQTSARERGAGMIFLEVRAGNSRAIRLYQQAGFNEIGRRRHYYPAPGGKEDALMMALML